MLHIYLTKNIYLYLDFFFFYLNNSFNALPYFLSHIFSLLLEFYVCMQSCTLNWEVGLFSQLTPTILGRCTSDVLLMLLLLLLFSDVHRVIAGSAVILFSGLSLFPEIVIFFIDLETAEAEATFWFSWSSAAIRSWLCFTGATCLTIGETRQGPCAHTCDPLR